jgi:retron-type reverse transcriptase
VYNLKPGKAEKHPIGVPTVIDRRHQRSTAKVLESIFDQDFLDCSYGSRPERRAHQAVSFLKHTIFRGFSRPIARISLEASITCGWKRWCSIVLQTSEF